YVLGMRVDVDEENVTKVYLFGLLRERIPRDALTFDVDESRDRYGWSIERYQFMNERGPGYFGLYSGWCWRSGDVEYLYNISKGKRDWNFGVHRQNRRLVQAIVVLPIAAIVVLVVVAKMASPG
ncbi:MAG TPA: hypothetical protein VFL29_00325, partial [Candidatus Dormibacteraeota bacterium]|nr:hypothetical protein [Candidatus Dormibacteraeota bacterium]